jgi:predicted O-methyltransferase YrrM
MEGMLFRPFMDTPEKVDVPKVYAHLKNPLFAWAGVRPVFAQHTLDEDRALQAWVRDKKVVVEIGVAEGGSAVTLNCSMADTGDLYLVDPYHLSRFSWINSPKRAAHAAIRRSSRALQKKVEVVWIEDFSSSAVRSWNRPIDFLFLDGDHDARSVLRDWEDWHRFVVPKGIVAFHDARVFSGGWTRDSDGPVRIVNGLFREQKLKDWQIIDEVHSLVFLEKFR